MDPPTASNSKVVEDRRGTVYIENPQKDSHYTSNHLSINLTLALTYTPTHPQHNVPKRVSE